MTNEEALEHCIAMVLASNDKVRVQQIRDFLDGDGPYLPPRPRDEVGRFCELSPSVLGADLKPWEAAPYQQRDGTRNSPADRLHRLIVQAAISPYHPDPLKPFKRQAPST